MAVRRSHIFLERANLYKISRGLIKQIAADYVWSAAINQVPVVNATMSPHIKIEQLLSARFGRFFVTSLPIHNANRSRPYLVDRTIEQFLNLFKRHVNELFCKRKDLPHAHTNKLITLAVLAFA